VHYYYWIVSAQASLLRNIKELQDLANAEAARVAQREQELERELKHLQAAVRSAEQRNEELSCAVPQATRPLLRQIQALQDNAAAQSEAWTQLERWEPTLCWISSIDPFIQMFCCG
jgi:hypothetical protein